jgi:serine/threonine protein phosphatase PrpC
VPLDWPGDIKVGLLRHSSCRVCFAGVFDGHGGKDVAILAAERLHEQVLLTGLEQVGCRRFGH